MGTGKAPSGEITGLSSPDSACGKLQRICLELLREHALQDEDGLPTNSRFLGYELMQRGILSKKSEKGARRGDQNLHEALTHLRQAGIIPWHWSTDETRSLSDYTGWPSIVDWATTMVEHVGIDPWGGQAPFVLTESRSLSGVLDNVARRYRVKLAATNGQRGGFLHTDVAPQLSPGDCVFYCGDWDWQGHQIEQNTRRVLERLIGSELDWERIALTEEQVDEYNLRPLATEALRQDVIVGIVREQLNGKGSSAPPCSGRCGRGAGNEPRRRQHLGIIGGRRHRTRSDGVQVPHQVEKADSTPCADSVFHHREVRAMTRGTGSSGTGSETIIGPGAPAEIKSEPGGTSTRRSATVSRKLADTLAYPPRLLRSDRAAAYLSMSESHFLKLVGQGRLPKYKRLGGITFWDRVMLDNFVDAYEGEEAETRVDDDWSKMLREPR